MQSEEFTPLDIEPTPIEIVGSGRFWTIPTTLMTLPRAALGAVIPFMAAQGKHTRTLAVLGALSDKETPVAELADKLFPNAGVGKSVAGADLDYKADFSMGFGSLVAAAIAKRSRQSDRLGALFNATKLASQANWAVRTDRKHRAVFGEPLRTKVGWTGKTATAAMLASNVAATISRDMKVETPEQQKRQKYISYGGVSLAGLGMVLGKVAERQNGRQFRDKVALWKNN